VIPGANSSLIIEAAFAIVTLLVAFALPGLGGRLWEAPERWGRTLGRRRALAVSVVGIAAPLLRLAILPLAPIPQPAVHDEFSHLLAGETFASGRLSNPTHPMWIHFETFHEDQKPRYMSMYPPFQGLFLAFGQVALGQPWFGVCIGIGLMCAAICWMLQGWLPPGWALIGGIVAVLRVGVLSYWMNSYWGGAVPAIGGALVLGALPRLIRRPQVGVSLVMGLGFAILANSRPYEGFLLGLPAGVALMVWMAKKWRRSPPNLARVAIPLTLFLLITAGAMGYYNSRVFGSPLTLPYQINRATYAVSPVFVWQSSRSQPVYHHKVMRDFYLLWELPVFEKARTVSGFLESAATKIGMLLVFFLGPLLMIPLLALPKVLRDRRIYFLLIAGAFFMAGCFANAFSVPHYLAPVTALIYAVLLQSMRHLRLWRPGGQHVGLFLVRAVILLCIATFAIDIARTVSMPKTDLPRTQVLHSLENIPGRQLAIVRYAPRHDPMAEWVYNTSQIEDAKVVWARDMGPVANAALLSYFKDRRPWLVEPDCKPPKVSPYDIKNKL
jgi:hypothetical protein